MSKAVMLSIRPRWCGLISLGKKTVEVRRTRPKLNPPFTCYIYQTKSHVPAYLGFGGKAANPSGVIGEFVCDSIYTIDAYPNQGALYTDEMHEIEWQTQLSWDELVEYQKGRACLFGWHISLLRMYDVPRRIEDFGLTRSPQSYCYIGG